LSKHAPGIYVEILIRGTMEELWEKTQNPHLHARWDLRFTHIEYLPKADGHAAKQFLYATRIGFGLNIQGRGESVGDTSLPHGQRTSALKFWSHDWKSLIRTGSGYWKYTPQPVGIQFETGYDYDVRFGLPGEWIDRFLLRPLIGWATAWSFDRLRLWIENKTEPSEALRSSVRYAAARIFLASALFLFGTILIWIWNIKTLFAANSGGAPLILLLCGALVVAMTWLWTWQTRALRARIPFARHCRRERGS
jgi:hypothetical protein